MPLNTTVHFTGAVDVATVMDTKVVVEGDPTATAVKEEAINPDVVDTIVTSKTIVQAPVQNARPVLKVTLQPLHFSTCKAAALLIVNDGMGWE